MVLPIYLYGQPILRKETEEITKDYPKLKELIANMFETMYNADGVGLAAPQVGLPIRLFIVDLEPLSDEDPRYADFKKVFINPKIIEKKGNIIKMNEGCLSLPGISESVEREDTIRIQYLDDNFEPHDEEYGDFFARCIQHEYDHLEATLFIDHISAIRKQLIKSKLNNLVKGKVNCHYKIKAVGKK